jgi:hypothetical protein
VREREQEEKQTGDELIEGGLVGRVTAVGEGNVGANGVDDLGEVEDVGLDGDADQLGKKTEEDNRRKKSE